MLNLCLLHMVHSPQDSIYTIRETELLTDWTPIKFTPTALRFIARLSARTFMPGELCRNEDWLRISVGYTIHFVTGGYVMRAIPPLFRPFVHWFLPQARQCREDVATARRIVEPTIIAHRKKAAEDIKAGKTPKKYVDAFAWMDAVTAKSEKLCDAVHGKISLFLNL